MAANNSEKWPVRAHPPLLFAVRRERNCRSLRNGPSPPVGLQPTMLDERETHELLGHALDLTDRGAKEPAS